MKSVGSDPGWKLRRLGDLHAGHSGTLDPQNYPDEVFDYYSIPAYQAGGRPAQEAGRNILSNKLELSSPCLLFGKLNPRVEKVWNVTELNERRAIASTEWLPVVPTDELDQSFGYFLLRSGWVMLTARSDVSGSTPSRQRVKPASFYDLRVPLPPIVEQRAIASVLERLCALIEAQVVCEQSAIALKRATNLSVFARGLRGETQKSTEVGPVPYSWEIASLGELGRIGNGSTPKRGLQEYWADGHFPWLTSAKVYDREITDADQFVTDTALRECHLPIVEPGAVLIAITGQGKTLGHCAVLRTRSTLNQHLAYLATDLDRADPSFVRGYLETQYDKLRQVGAGGGSTKGALTCAYLRSVLIPLPRTLEEQREVAAVLDTLDRRIASHRRKRAVLDRLFNALLDKLMVGGIRVADLHIDALVAETPVAGASA